MATPTGNTKRSKKTHQHQVNLVTPELSPQQAEDVRPQQPAEYYDENDDFAQEEDLYGSPMDENMDHRVHIAQERLSRLRKEAEDIEREKMALEDLRRKQNGFMQGRIEMVDRLSRAVALLDRETQDSRRKIEQMLVMRETFADHMEAVHGLVPEEWSRQNLQTELSRALGIIEDAKMEYDRSMTRLQAYTNNPVATPAAAAKAPASLQASLPVGFTKEAFRQWAFYGLAFTAPLIAAAAIFGLFRLIF